MFEEKQAMGKGECGRSCYSPDVNFIRVTDLETIQGSSDSYAQFCNLMLPCQRQIIKSGVKVVRVSD